jgi:hypothetical protein
LRIAGVRLLLVHNMPRKRFAVLSHHVKPVRKDSPRAEEVSCSSSMKVKPPGPGRQSSSP